MSRRRPVIPRRRPIFLGCEGESEQGYGQFLNDLAREADLHVHIEVVNLSPGAGDPVSRMQRARKEVEHRQRSRVEFDLKAALLDSDQIGNDPQRREMAEIIARESGIEIIWQSPCHEALLLRHFEGFEHRRPATKAEIATMLRQVWPSYQKPMTRLQLGKTLGLAHVRRAGQSEPALLAFLRRISIL
jgi:hypothetical protein